MGVPVALPRAFLSSGRRAAPSKALMRGSLVITVRSLTFTVPCRFGLVFPHYLERGKVS